uniref:Serine/threonine-protein phosphatase 5 n=1 Tax=Cacopsylla melanoneura TaxID=428564 RepID=A0A8D9EDT4_9HEMI
MSTSTTAPAPAKPAPVEVSTEVKEKAEKLKAEANEHFKNQAYDKAIDLYTAAIEINPNPIYYANRSFAYFKIESIGYALNDASKAIELDRTYTKAYYRRAAAYMSLGKFKLALRDYEAVYKVKPNDVDAKTKYTECNKIVKRLAFEKAISVDSKSVAESINFDSMSIEDEYSGPSLENDKVTLKFMLDLMETYKAQGKLHRKYAYKILMDIKALFMTQDSLIHISVEDEAKFTVRRHSRSILRSDEHIQTERTTLD